ncbi:mosc domain-containing protein [Phlyctema vagabunda]|uniref:Mosc domain-containing protein n=1 Tax=Phlyctema vagabunda TaxID=108571 RepID=A0ABR4PAU2_9HELO
MGSEISKWFSERFGYEVILVSLGNHSRAVFGSLAPSSPLALQRSLGTKLYNYLPFLAPTPERISFNDLAQYLIVTRSSTDELSSRLSDGSKMDVSKFRPNIVLSGRSPAFDEDFWSEVTIASSGDDGKKLKMKLTANCYRCQSITVDYRTGKPAAGDSGLVWKKLVADRRVDKGAKWSPVFGRYSFCRNADAGVILRVGDGVKVTGRNADRTTFDWPGLTTFGLTK